MSSERVASEKLLRHLLEVNGDTALTENKHQGQGKGVANSGRVPARRLPSGSSMQRLDSSWHNVPSLSWQISSGC